MATIHAPQMSENFELARSGKFEVKIGSTTWCYLSVILVGEFFQNRAACLAFGGKPGDPELDHRHDTICRFINREL